MEGAMHGVYRRGEVYYIDIYEGPRRIRKAVGRNKKIAEAYAIARRTSSLRGVPVLTPCSFGRLADEYLRFIAGSHRRETVEVERYHITRLVEFCGAGTAVGDVTTRRLDEYRMSRVAAGISASTVNRETNTASAMFSAAVRWGYIATSPTKGLERLPTDEKERRILTDDEIARLLAVAKGTWRAFVVFALNTGLRRAELCNAKWEHIADGWLTIPGETAKSRRRDSIPLNAAAKAALATLHPAGEYIFPSPTGGPMERSTINRALKRLFKAAKITGCSPHTLRHTFASKMVDCAPISTVRELMRHSDIKTTMRYVHESRERMEQAAGRLAIGEGAGEARETSPEHH